MKHLFFILLLTGLIKGHAQDKVPYTTKTYSSSAINNVEVATSGGYINVIGDAPSNAVIEIYIHGNNGKNNLSPEEITQRLNNYVLETGVSGGTLYAHAKTKDGFRDWRNSLSISFKIHVPKNVRTDLKTSGGSISLSSLNGSQNFTTSGGSLNVKDILGNIDGKTSGGSIEANNCKGTTIDLTTSGGSIKLKQLSGNVKAHTSGGSIDVQDISGNLDARTSGGSIDLDGSFGNVEAHTSGGSIDAAFKKVGASARLKTSAGGIHIELPQSQALSFDLKGNKVNLGAANNIQVNSGTGYAKGTINGGGPLVEASTSAGSVKVAFR